MKLINEMWDKFHKLMKSGRLPKVMKKFQVMSK